MRILPTALAYLAACGHAQRTDEERERAADAWVEEGRALPPGERRNALLARAAEEYGRAAAMLGSRIGEDQWRRLWKRGEALLEADPAALRRFFELMDLRGLAPAWDEGRWGYREKFETSRRRLPP